MATSTRTDRPALTDLIWHKYLRRPYRLRVYDHGGNGPVIIFLHGLASSSANWSPLIPLLKEKYRCISIDLIGFGDSPKPQWYEYTMDDHINCIRAAIRKLQLSEPFMLVGHSLGSLIATRYTRMEPGQVRRLVLLSPPVYAPIEATGSRAARQRTSMYLRAYRFLRTNKRVTPTNMIRLSRIIPQMKFLVLSSATWIPFIRSLEHCIEQQTVIEDIAALRTRVDIFYGIFDEVVVPYNIKQLTSFGDVTLHPLKVNHAVGKRYAQAVAKVLMPTSHKKHSKIHQ